MNTYFDLKRSRPQQPVTEVTGTYRELSFEAIAECIRALKLDQNEKIICLVITDDSIRVKTEIIRL